MSDNKPAIGSEWKHTHGNYYRVLLIANEDMVRPIYYPVTVVYEGTNGKIWSRPLSEWYRSMTPVCPLESDGILWSIK